MVNKFLSAGLLGAVMLLAAACGGPPGPVTQAVETPAPIKADVVAAVNETGWQLYRELAAEACVEENIFLSPAGLAFPLAMTYNGARGETAAAMARTLHWHDIDIADLNTAFLSLRQWWTALDEAVDGFSLQFANGLWQRQGRQFYAEFLDVNEEYYGAAAETADFDDPATLDAINRWVAAETGGHITDFLEEIRPDSVMFLLNALHFQGEWTVPFAGDRTRPAPFYPPDTVTPAAGDGTTADREMTVDMMHGDGEFAYYEGEGFTALRLPYGEEEQLAMYLFLPAVESDLAAFREQLTEANWRRWQAGFEQRLGWVALPRLQLAYKAVLDGPLRRLGMEVAFDAAAADFGAMGPVGPGNNLYIGQVLQETFLQVDEKGTAAAGATAVEIREESAPLYDFEFIAERPFFLAIQDEATGVVLFAGSVTAPEPIPAS